jgi:hypothetical protein
MSYTLTYNTSTVITTPAINSTKVTVFSNVACYSNINGSATTSSPITVLPNRKNDINMQGLFNTLSLLPVGGATAAITITQVGNVAASGYVNAFANGNVTATTGNVYTAG